MEFYFDFAKGKLESTKLADVKEYRFQFPSGHIIPVQNPFEALEQQKERIFREYYNGNGNGKNKKYTKAYVKRAMENVSIHKNYYTDAHLNTRGFTWREFYVEGDDEIEGDCHWHIVYDVVTGRWEFFSDLSEDFLPRFMCRVLQCELQREQTKTAAMQKQLDNIQAMFDHVRSKSSILDEFLKIVENVVAK